MSEWLRQNALTVLAVGIGVTMLVTLSASQSVRGREALLDVDPGEVLVSIVGGPEGPFSPGVVRHLDLTFTNSSMEDVVLTSVFVVVASVSAPRAGVGRPCLSSDFVASPGRLASTSVPAGRSVALSDTGLPRASWPSVRMVNSSVNQDGCKGAVVELDYRAVGEVR